jgi:hypothetical protein
MRTGTLLSIVAICASSAIAEEQCLSDAWASYNKSDYKAAIQAADRCIADFHLKAERDQAALAQRREPEPPTGAVGDSDKQKLFSRGVLNDVGAAYFVKGKSAEALGAKPHPKNVDYGAMARAAYEGAKKLTYARVWDPKGYFWSPAEAAGDRLADITR